MSLSPVPGNAQLVIQPSGDTSPTWLAWFSGLFGVTAALGGSGPTTARPVGTSRLPLYMGQQFFDTTLGYPVFIKSVGPPVVWVNGAGSVV